MQLRYVILALGALLLYSQRYSLKGYAMQATKNWTTFDELFEKYAKQYGVNVTWLKAIAMNESSLGLAKSVARGLENPQDIQNSVSSDGKSWGLMQVTLSTARTMDSAATPQKLNNAEYSVKLAAQYIAQLMRMFPKTDPRFTEWVIKSYNQGPGNTAKERTGKPGYADEYWARFERNLNKITGSKK